MNYLIISILLNAYLGIVFVFFNKLKIDLFQAIVYNYITCVVTGSYMSGGFPLTVSSIDEEWFKWALLMGFLFISIFNIIALSSVKVGVTVTQTSNKLSLIIPVLFSWYVYHETIGWVKWAGIVLALIAVILTMLKAEKSAKKHAIWVYALPLILFIGSGMIDTLTNYVTAHFIKNDTMANTYLIAGFFVAAFLGFLVLLLLYVFKQKTFHIKHLIAGIVLGVPNYFSIFYLIKALNMKGLSSSAVIPINNIGILFIVTLFGVFIFKERLSKLNILGVVLTVVSMLLIYFGDRL
jgi:drug/metabolite transporter (DMT)-like permease